jgi:hypothetical protein
MSVTIRTLSASVNVPKPTASSTFDDALESYLSKAIATGEVNPVAGIIQGFRVYATPEVNNSIQLAPAPNSVSSAVFLSENGASMYVETARTYTIPIPEEMEFATILALVPNFETRRVSFVFYGLEEVLDIPQTALLVCLLVSEPEEEMSGDRVYYAVTFPEFEGEEGAFAYNFRRSQYDPQQKQTAIYKEVFADTNPVEWVETTGYVDVTTVSELGSSGRGLRIVLNGEEEATITFPHRMTPYFDTYEGDVQLINNKVRVKLTYATSPEFVIDEFNVAFRTSDDLDRESFIYLTPSTPDSPPKVAYAEFTPDNLRNDRNYRLVLNGRFTGELYIFGVDFECDLDPTGRFVDGAIIGPDAGGGGGGGGGGVTVITDGGTISGTYTGNVFCEGNVTITGDVTILGDLNTNSGTCYNTGYSVEVHGSWYSDGVDFNTLDENLQRSIRVFGNWIYRAVQIENTFDSNSIVVWGDLIAGEYGEGSSNFWFNGADGHPGGTIYVYGGITAYNIYANGGDATETLNAGSGGYIYCYGHAKANDIQLHGGDAFSFSGRNAGNGGNAYINGDLYMDDFRADGGDATDSGSAGNGGLLEVEGNCVIDEIACRGGDCTSASHLYYSGTGGTLRVEGNLVADEIDLQGGDRFGTLTQSGGGPTPNGGELFVGGSAIISDLNVNGGVVDTIDYAPHNGGNGGYISISGDLRIGDIYAQGGNSSFSSAGSGSGNFTINGNLHMSGTLNADGGSSTNGYAANAGYVYVSGDAIVNNVYMSGGEAGGGSPDSGGNGGSLQVQGALQATSSINLNGGYSFSTANMTKAGSGGNLNVGSFRSSYSIYLIGGFQGNEFSTPLTPNGGLANGGSVTCSGVFRADSVYLTGGTVATGAPSNPGGNGGSLNVSGLCYIHNVCDVSGGSASGADGGTGGSLNIYGNARINEILSNGGASVDSPLGGDMATAGAGGNVQISSGGVFGIVELKDGLNGTTPTQDTTLTLAGNVSIGTLQVADRVNGLIRPISSTSPPVVMKINSISFKTTLNDWMNVATGDVSGLVADSIFMTTNTGEWVYIQGTSIP